MVLVNLPGDDALRVVAFEGVRGQPSGVRIRRNNARRGFEVVFKRPEVGRFMFDMPPGRVLEHLFAFVEHEQVIPRQLAADAELLQRVKTDHESWNIAQHIRRVVLVALKLEPRR